jgi:site-specific DNA-methyltransferase (adenine-specific)
MDALSLMALLEDDSIDMGITSPPYDNLREYNGHYEFDFEAIAHETYRVLKPGGVLVWVVGDATINGSETLTSMRQALYFVDVVGFKMHDTMVWEKAGNPFPCSNRYYQVWEYMFVLSKGKPKAFNLAVRKVKYKDARNHKNRGRNKGGVFQFSKNEKHLDNTALPNVWKMSNGGGISTKDKEAYAHPAMFPEKLAERHILTWSNPGDIVLDYFMGSGTTAKMARNNGRHYIGCDVNLEYVQLARQRLAKPYTLSMFDEQPKQDDSKAEQLMLFDEH